MNYKSKKDLEIASINLKEDFDMVISFIRTTKDLEVGFAISATLGVNTSIIDSNTKNLQMFPLRPMKVIQYLKLAP